MLKKRVITALCGIPFLIAAIWFDKPLPWFLIAVAVWGVLAVFEFYRMVAESKVPPDDGRNWVFLALFATFGSDTAAFFAGRALGRHKLSPHISPQKTWEGAIAGLLGAIVISLLFTIPTPLSLPLSYGQAILLGLLVSIFGQLGDLAESLLKRSMGVKDSGRLVPGHGGFLDRMDSIVFASIVVYYYVVWAM